MSRIANSPINLPSGVEVQLSERHVNVTGNKGTLELDINALVKVTQEDKLLKFTVAKEKDKISNAMAGTFRALVYNMVQGVCHGYSKELSLVGVGYRAKLSGKKLELSLGFSHPVVFEAPQGIEIEVSKPTKIVIKGIDKRLVGQVAADIRALRPPEPYKGKGVRYPDEYIKRKDAKKK